MATTITRKVYDAAGTEETAFGLPCSTETNEWDGSVKSGNDALQIDDAFPLDDLTLSGVGGTGLVALAAKIAEVQSQERCIPSDILTPTVSGYAIDAEGATDWDSPLTAEVEEVTPADAIEVGGITVKHLWKAFGGGDNGVSYIGIEGGVLMDRRKSMAGYVTANAQDVVFKVLPAKYASEAITTALDIESVGEDVEVDAVSGDPADHYDITTETAYLLGVFSRVNLDAMLGICGIKIGKDGGVASWMVTAHNVYGIAYENLVKAYAIDKEIKKSFDGTGRWLVGDGSSYINTGIDNDSWNTLQVIATMRITKASTSGESGYFGGKGASSTQAPAIYSGQGSLAVNSWCGSGTSWSMFTAVLNKKFKLDLTFDAVNSNRVLSLNDGTATTKSVNNTGRNNGGQLAIFADGSTPAAKAYMDVQLWQIIKNGTDKYFFIPFIKDSVCGMYDLIGQQFYANANTSGTFTIQ